MAKQKTPAPAPLVPNKPSSPLATYDYGALAGAGMEGVGSDHVAVPFIAVLQSLSPQCLKADPKYIPGAEAGAFFNTVSGEVIPSDPGLVVVPVETEHLYTCWTPRDKGGGFKGTYAVDSRTVLEASKHPTKNILQTKQGAELLDLVETFQLYCMVLAYPDSTEEIGFAVIPFTSTKIKKYKALMYRLRMIKGQPPLFAHRVLLTTVSEKNAEGSYYNIEARPAVGTTAQESLIPPTLDGKPHPLLLKGKDYLDMIRAGKAKANYDSASDAAEADTKI